MNIVWKDKGAKLYYLYDKKKKRAFSYNPFRTKITAFLDKDTIEGRLQTYTYWYDIYYKICNKEELEKLDKLNEETFMYENKRIISISEIEKFSKQLNKGLLPNPKDVIIKEIKL